MKKWMYLIFPGGMLAAFLVFFLSHTKEMDAREHERAIKVQQQQKEAAAKKTADEARAAADAKKRQQEREAEETAKAEQKRLKQVAADKEVSDATTKALNAAATSQKEVSSLDADLDTLRKAKDKALQEAFDLARQVERAKVERRNAELEIQRTTEMIAERALASSLARMPTPPPPPPVAK
ncbi:MAG: hypothetical protein EXS32_00580 [Opitutus sp.]|nr:hypothetical protein [Opitutus sp.]